MNEEMIYGTECKLKITLPKIDDTDPYNYNFDIELYTNPKKKLVVNKYLCYPVEGEPNQFIVPFDSSKIGIGDVNLELVVYVPDAHFPDNLRTERRRLESITTIIP